MNKAKIWLSSIQSAFAPDGAVNIYGGYLWCIGYGLVLDLRDNLLRPPKHAADTVQEYQDFMLSSLHRNPLTRTYFDEFFRACQNYVCARMKQRMYPELPTRIIEAENRLQDAAYELISKVRLASEVTVIAHASLDPRLPVVLDFALQLAKADA